MSKGSNKRRSRRARDAARIATELEGIDLVRKTIPGFGIELEKEMMAEEFWATMYSSLKYWGNDDGGIPPILLLEIAGRGPL